MKKILLIIIGLLSIIIVYIAYLYVDNDMPSLVPAQPAISSSSSSTRSIASLSSISASSGVVKSDTSYLIQQDILSFNSFLLNMPEGWMLDKEQLASVVDGVCRPGTKGEACLYRDIVKDNLKVRLFNAKHYPPVPSSNNIELFTVSHPAFKAPFIFSYNNKATLTSIDGCYEAKLCVRVTGEYNQKDADELKKLLNDMVN
jgi:hypothetical protein